MQILKHFLLLWQNASLPVRRRIVIIFSFLLLSNALVWIFGVFLSPLHPLLLGLLALAYGLGLRHAVDADHIAVIDNITRKLMLDGKRPVAVGLFFSLGHATIVVILSILVAISSSFIKNSLPSIQAASAIIGTFVSSFFLILIGIINLVAFFDILQIFRHATKDGKTNTHNHLQHTHGFLTRIFKPVLKTVTSSWHMYFVGFLFGLGFDTASEVGLLSISAASGATTVSFWEIILLPLAFTAALALIDTLDGIFMLGAYGWAYIKPVRKLYYNLTITGMSVFIALFIGGVEAIQLLSRQLNLHGVFFTFANTLDLGNLGYITIVSCIMFWAISIAVYKIKHYDHLT